MNSRVQDIDDMNFEGVEIKLDKIRHIKYTFRGLKAIAAKFGSVVDTFNQMKNLNEKIDVEMIDTLALLLYAGLIHEDKNITIEHVENLIDLKNSREVFEKVIDAFSDSVSADDDKGNDDKQLEGESAQGESQTRP